MNRTVDTEVCIVGGGPAGLMLGLLLAKAGTRVLVLESHSNFDREYRGEVLQPRFLQMLEELGLRDYIESFPGSKVRSGAFYYKEKLLGEFRFDSFSKDIPYALWMPQPILLNALYDKARAIPTFDLLYQASVNELLWEGDGVCGVVADTPDGPVTVRARVTVGADGRFSAVRRLGGFEMEYEHHPGDLIWFSVPRPAGWGEALRMKLTDGHGFVILPKYPDLLQVGMAVLPGEWRDIRSQGIAALKKELLAAHPAFRVFAEELQDFKPFVLLQAKAFYVREWAKNGCLLIGDAAHCASPIGAVGVSLSVATAVTAAGVIHDALQDNDVSAARLHRVQELRGKELRAVHRIQERGAKIMFASSPALRSLVPVLITLAARLRLISRIQRRTLLQPQPLNVHPRFQFEG
ncbi:MULTISPECIES: FAD-dependent monooxygenase [Paenibacillus]|uniref:FAD-dependent monooxygenase n=1 Tax=Paenibacillus TaxID=44249 RepID=UPI0022B8AEA7|nr:FAD-dependent monooxygenase [Paenibacillus caseinilyticus]MCZ8523217.1 FAD-dependent monooxygenase [Paenibacillus caseinilyticus]